MRGRTQLSLAVLLGALGGLRGPSPTRERERGPDPRRSEAYANLRDGTRRENVKPTKHTPHQNVRECARRIGGRTWELYKEWDRCERRGWPPLKR